MTDREPETAAQRMLAAFELSEFGRELVELRLARENPGESPERIRARLWAWLRARPLDATSHAEPSFVRGA